MTSILFLGSNWEALSTLKVLNEDNRFKIVGLITQPDKPIGRERITQVSDIKKYATEKKIPVFHTEKDKLRYREAITLFKPDLIVCKSFGEIIPEFVLEAPKYGSINVHYSLLPRHRGAVPIQKAILDGDEITGITYVKMVKKLDAGEILTQIEEKIEPDDTNESLRRRLVDITAKTIGDVLERWIKGEIIPKPQDESKATYCQQSDISKENAFIDLAKMDPTKIDRMVRAFIPWPIAWTYYKEKRLKLFDIALIERSYGLQPGVYGFDGNSLFVGTTSDEIPTIELKNIQLEGKVVMSGKQFALGQQIEKV